MNTPLVSIIIPTYNRAHLIGETLASVQAQTYPHWECIVVDDGSTDNTEEAMQEWLKDERFKFYKRHREPKGAPTCRNIGLEKAIGDLIIFFDSDDIMLDYCLKNRVKYFVEDENLDLLISYQKRMENGVETFLVNVPSEVDPLIRFYTLPPNIDIPFLNNSTTIKRSFLINYDLVWNETIKAYQDIQFNISLLSRLPKWKWSEDKFDSYWRYDANEKNIGRHEGMGIEIMEKRIFFYQDNLLTLDTNYSYRSYLYKQWQHVLYSFLKKAANDREYSKKEYLSLLSSFKEIRFIERCLLKLLAIIGNREKRYYVHRFLRKLINNYFSNKYKPLVKKGTLLKIKEVKKNFNDN